MVDVICLTKTDAETYEMVCRTLFTLRHMDKAHKFNIILVESGETWDYSKYIDSYIISKEPFGYNKYINIASRYCSNDWVVIINNDLLFEKNWFTEIMNVHAERPDIESFTPKDPILYARYYDHHFMYGHDTYYESYKVTEFLGGWCLVMTKRVFDLMCPWDEDFDMYYQDNDYAKVIESKGVKHALVRHSLVSHLKSLNIIKLNDSAFVKMRQGEQKYLDKWEMKINKEMKYKIVQVATGLITIPPNGWGAVERIIWSYTDRLRRLGVDVEIQQWNEVTKQENQLVHCHMANTALDMLAKGIPYVYSLHDHHAEYYGKDSGVYHNNLAAIKGSVFSICHAKHVVGYFDDTDKLFYLPHGVDTEFFKPIVPDLRDDKKLLMICNNGMAGDSTIDRKGFRIAIAAAKWFNLPITIAGPENNLEFFKGHLDLLEYDKLTLKCTNPTDAETLELYQTHSIFMAPSMLEYGHPNLAILEAMSCGLPIVGTCNAEVPGMYRMSEISIAEARKGLATLDREWFKYYTDQLEARDNYDWSVVCKQLKKMYDAAGIINKRWTSEDTTKAYIETYV
jgi:glycosyltransferase involved in cell wall biosynthesis